MTQAVIVSTARTPLCKSWKGAFNMTHGATLGGHAIDEIEAYRGVSRRLYFRHPVMGLFRFPGINDYQWEKM